MTPWWLIFMLTPLPSSTADDIHYATTSDGARIAVRRLAATGPPVIFFHGIAVNGEIWNLPEVRTPEFHYRSIAQMLHEQGYDVWLVSLRGMCGPDYASTPPPGQTDWCVDHFILYDVPAVIAHVCTTTGQRPVVVGSSMGSMCLAGYLEGTALETHADGLRIVSDPNLAASRQMALAGAVLCEFPAALRWPSSAYRADGRLDWQTLLRGWRQPREDANLPFEFAARLSWLEALVQAGGEVPLSRLRGAPGRPWYDRLPAPWSRRAAEWEGAIVQRALKVSGSFTGCSNLHAEILLHGRRFVLDDIKAGVLKQLGHCVRQRAFVSALGTPPFVYSEHYETLALPVLVVQGGRDRIANADTTRTAFFDRVRSRDKTWLFDPDIAHGETQAAPAACERIYPKVIAWIAARTGEASSQPICDGERPATPAGT